MIDSTPLQTALDNATHVVLGDSTIVRSSALLDCLKRMGVPAILLTAARQRDAGRGFLGRFYSCTPADKARIVRCLREEGARVAFFGLGGSDQWGMMCADVRIDSAEMLAGFGILPEYLAGEAA